MYVGSHAPISQSLSEIPLTPNIVQFSLLGCPFFFSPLLSSLALRQAIYQHVCPLCPMGSDPLHQAAPSLCGHSSEPCLHSGAPSRHPPFPAGRCPLSGYDASRRAAFLILLWPIGSPVAARGIDTRPHLMTELFLEEKGKGKGLYKTS